MAGTVDVADDDEQHKTPLLSRGSPPRPPPPPSIQHGEPVAGAALTEIVPSVSPDDQHVRPAPPSNRRLASLDVFRGLTVAVSCSVTASLTVLAAASCCRTSFDCSVLAGFDRPLHNLIELHLTLLFSCVIDRKR